jgi:hypothetical protein
MGGYAFEVAFTNCVLRFDKGISQIAEDGCVFMKGGKGLLTITNSGNSIEIPAGYCFDSRLGKLEPATEDPIEWIRD